MAQSAPHVSDIRQLGPDDVALVSRFIAELPEGDLTFFKEVVDEAVIARWCTTDERELRWLVVGEDGEPQAMLGIFPGALWSSHVGELRLVVGRDYRRLGLGRRLARYGLAEGVRLGMSKIVVEVVADKEGDINMFTSIGFDPEALLRDHIRDRDGNLRDLVLLSHEVGDRSAALDVIGLDGDLGPGGGA
jgi:ribosomal protein S18 acetylase RimI-like enzyme